MYDRQVCNLSHNTSNTNILAQPLTLHYSYYPASDSVSPNSCTTGSMTLIQGMPRVLIKRSTTCQQDNGCRHRYTTSSTGSISNSLRMHTQLQDKSQTRLIVLVGNQTQHCHPGRYHLTIRYIIQLTVPPWQVCSALSIGFNNSQQEAVETGLQEQDSRPVARCLFSLAAILKMQTCCQQLQQTCYRNKSPA